jgi:hypothetical protein
MSEHFTLPHAKEVEEKYFVTIDIASWLQGEAISTVAFTAIKISDNSDASTDILDAGKCTYSGSILKPYIKAGVGDERYYVKMKVTTDASEVPIGVFVLLLFVEDVSPT